MDIEVEKIKILGRMEEAIREDRERFFKVADTIRFQPKYTEYLTELETLCQWFRDVTKLTNFPNIDWPPKLPEWFPKVPFASSFKKDEYLDNELNRLENEMAMIKQQERLNL